MSHAPLIQGMWDTCPYLFELCVLCVSVCKIGLEGSSTYFSVTVTTRRTSSKVVYPILTFSQPPWPSVRMPFLRAQSASVRVLSRFRTS